MCGPEDPLFTPLLQFARVPFQAKESISSQDPLLKKIGNFSLYSFIFHPKFNSQAPKFGNFQLTSPQIWKFSVHKPPNLGICSSQVPLFRGKYQFASPTLRKSGPHTPTWKKKLSAPPPREKSTSSILCIHTVLSLINAPGALQFFKRGMFIRGKFSMQKCSV